MNNMDDVILSVRGAGMKRKGNERMANDTNKFMKAIRNDMYGKSEDQLDREFKEAVKEAMAESESEHKKGQEKKSTRAGAGLTHL